jgi:hypothetical protein
MRESHEPLSGEGGIEIFILFYFLETFQSPRPHGGSVMHDGSSVGAGGLKCDSHEPLSGEGGIVSLTHTF